MSDAATPPPIAFDRIGGPVLLVNDALVEAASPDAVAMLGTDPKGTPLGDVAVDGVMVVDPGGAGRRVVLLSDGRHEERLHHIVDAVADSTFTLDESGAILWRSQRLVMRSGISDEALAHAPEPLDRIHPEDIPVVLSAFTQLVADPGGELRLTIRSRAVDDDDVWQVIELVGRNRLDDPPIGGLLIQVHNLDEGRRVPDLSRSGSDLQSLAESVPLGILMSDSAGRIVYRNPVAQKILGEQFTSFDRDEWLHLVRPEEREAVAAVVDRARSGAGSGSVTAAVDGFGGATGRPRWFRLRMAPHLDADGRTAGVIATLEDVTESTEARAEAERLTRMLDASSDYVVVWRPEPFELIWANAVSREMLAVPLPGGGERRLRDLLEDEARERFVASAGEALEHADFWHGELIIQHPSKGPIPVSALGVVQRTADNGIESVALVARDISDLKAAEERLLHMATHDGLTGLPNRALLTEHLERAVTRHRRTNEGVAVLFCDLDGFKPVNDRFGHGIGDVVLTEAARRLEAATRDTDLLTRVGGDEFVVLCERVDNGDDLDDVARRLIDALAVPILVEGESIVLTCSVGVAVAGPGVEPDPDVLLSAADSAMYQAKALGRSRHVVRRVGS